MNKEQDKYLFNLFIKAFHDWHYEISECFDLCEMVKAGMEEDKAKECIEEKREYEKSKVLAKKYIFPKGE